MNKVIVSFFFSLNLFYNILRLVKFENCLLKYGIMLSAYIFFRLCSPPITSVCYSGLPSFLSFFFWSFILSYLTCLKVMLYLTWSFDVWFSFAVEPQHTTWARSKFYRIHLTVGQFSSLKSLDLGNLNRLEHMDNRVMSSSFSLRDKLV